MGDAAAKTAVAAGLDVEWHTKPGGSGCQWVMADPSVLDSAS